MKNNVLVSKKIPGFTLVELIFVVLIIGLIMPAMFALYNFIVRSNTEIEARQETIQQGYEFFERLNILMQDYTIDYEEYYNRQMVGCVDGGGTGSNFTWNIGLSGYCTEFTAYGNENSIKDINSNRDISSGYYDIYYCSSESSSNLLLQGDGRHHVVVGSNHCGKVGSKQSYGQYEALFTDVGTDTDYRIGSTPIERIGDSDDRSLGITVGPGTIDAIEDADHIQELYFISHDGKSRLYFRRKLVNTGNNYTQYKIQMLRLRGFDAGQKHDFSTTDNEGLYDGKIDTWACDAGMGFESISGASLGGAYEEYKLPYDVDDCWIDLTHGSTTILAWNIIISPVTDSDLAWLDVIPTRQINAYMKILTVNGVYAPYYLSKLSESIRDFKVPLETIINMKDFYRN